MSRLEAIGRHIQEHRSGMVVDMVFAIAWVTVVTVVLDVLMGAPQWLYYLTLLGGIVAYYGFFWTLEAVSSDDET
ncbi:hypothetical protein ACFQGE_10385 [Halomicroarcula sp. GCM10025817]|uniref:hypothetical protein n=1 Tax=Haloarcula TaxID=2237 RepID=UPI0023E7792E|nr:hypothetical protein [Halomicroarcula sp. SYNS111]